MKMQFFGRILLLAGTVYLVNQSHAQLWIPSPPPFPGTVTSSVAPPALYDESTGVLSIPLLESISRTENLKRSFANVRLNATEDGHFELGTFIELPQQPLCNQDDVDAAIPQLSLDLDLAAAEELFGCSGSISTLATSTINGKLASVTWPENGLSERYARGPDSFVTPLTSFHPFLTFPASASLVFQEGELIRYVVAHDPRSDQCQSSIFTDLFPALQNGMHYSEVRDLLGCEGSINYRAVEQQGETYSVSWHALVPIINEFGFVLTSSQRTEAITINFVDENVESFSYALNLPGFYGGPDSVSCSADQLIEAQQTLSSGQVVYDLLEQVDCQPNLHTILVNDGVTTENVSWQTGDSTGSPLLSSNRNLSVTVINGNVVAASLTRF